jgi:hypothetical protein
LKKAELEKTQRTYERMKDGVDKDQLAGTALYMDRPRFGYRQVFGKRLGEVDASET